MPRNIGDAIYDCASLFWYSFHRFWMGFVYFLKCVWWIVGLAHSHSKTSKIVYFQQGHVDDMLLLLRNVVFSWYSFCFCSCSLHGFLVSASSLLARFWNLLGSGHLLAFFFVTFDVRRTKAAVPPPQRSPKERNGRLSGSFGSHLSFVCSLWCPCGSLLAAFSILCRTLGVLTEGVIHVVAGPQLCCAEDSFC